MMTWFIDVFKVIITQSDDFSHHQHTFLGGWIDRHLMDNAPNRNEVLMSTLLTIFDKCKSLQYTGKIFFSFFFIKLAKKKKKNS